MKLSANYERPVRIGFNILISLLLLCVFLQCGVFLHRYMENRGGDTQMPFSMRMLSVSAVDGVNALDTDLLVPAAMALSKDGVAHAVLNSAVVIGDFYEELSPHLAACFAAEPSSANETEWNMAVTFPDVIYIRYRSEMPYQVLHAFAAAGTDGDVRVREPIGIGVAELCLRFMSEEAILVVRGSNGVYSFTAPTQGSVAQYSSYASVYSDVFYLCTLRAGTDKPALTVTEQITARELLAVGANVSYLLEDKEDLTTILRRFSFNPDKLNYHTEPDGSTVFVESHGVLLCGHDRIVYTASEGGGIRAAEFCMSRDSADIYLYLTAASAWISELSAMDMYYVGGSASPQLVSVTGDGPSVTLHFGLFMDNLPVYYEGENILVSITFAGDIVTQAVWHPVLVNKQLTAQKTFLEEWSRSVLKAPEVHLAYRADSERQRVSAEWIAYRTEKEDTWAGTE